MADTGTGGRALRKAARRECRASGLKGRDISDGPSLTALTYYLSTYRDTHTATSQN